MRFLYFKSFNPEEIPKIKNMNAELKVEKNLFTFN